MLFIIMHQTMELWLKLVLHEGRLVHEAIKADRLQLAGKGLDRIATIQRQMIQSWAVLATLTPHDFLTLRGFLRRALGCPSQQSRALKLLPGNQRAGMTLVQQDTTPRTDELRAGCKPRR